MFFYNYWTRTSGFLFLGPRGKGYNWFWVWHMWHWNVSLRFPLRYRFSFCFIKSIFRSELCVRHCSLEMDRKRNWTWALFSKEILTWWEWDWSEYTAQIQGLNKIEVVGKRLTVSWAREAAALGFWSQKCHCEGCPIIPILMEGHMWHGLGWREGL